MSKNQKTVTVADLESQLNIKDQLLGSAKSELPESPQLHKSAQTESSESEETNQTNESESETMNQETTETTQETVKTLQSLVVGDQVLLTHTVRSKVVKELKEITEVNSKAVKIGSLQFDPVTGFGRQLSQGKKITLPTAEDLQVLQEAQAKETAYTEARFKLMELSSLLEEGKANSQTVKDFTYQLGMLSGMIS